MTSFPSWLTSARTCLRLVRPRPFPLIHPAKHLTSRSELSGRQPRRLFLLIAGGTIGCLALGGQYHTHCRGREGESDREREQPLGEKGKHSRKGHAPRITLYQYSSCPYCNKTRAFLDYYGLGYEAVEVHPVFKREIKFSSYKRVPFAVIDGEQVNDSSLVISVLRTSMLRGMEVSSVLPFYPEISSKDKKGHTVSERANKYFLMYGEAAIERSPDELREERKWREWVDESLVHTIPPNIYRTFSEALQSFDYISRVSNFNWLERFVAKYTGAVSMYFISKSLKKKYHLKPDVRESLYDHCNQWTRAIGKYRTFLGGDRPNLADLSVYGVLHSMEGLDVFGDLMTHTKIKRWYSAVHQLVQSHAGQPESPQT